MFYQSLLHGGYVYYFQDFAAINNPYPTQSTTHFCFQITSDFMYSMRYSSWGCHPKLPHKLLCEQTVFRRSSFLVSKNMLIVRGTTWIKVLKTSLFSFVNRRSTHHTKIVLSIGRNISNGRSFKKNEIAINVILGSNGLIVPSKIHSVWWLFTQLIPSKKCRSNFTLENQKRVSSIEGSL